MINDVEFIQTMRAWKHAKERLIEMEIDIKEYVLSKKDTHVLDGVEAKYSQGRKKYDYVGCIKNEIANGDISIESLDSFKEVSIDYRKACKTFGINKNDLEYTQSEPSVSINLVKDKK